MEDRHVQTFADDLMRTCQRHGVKVTEPEAIGVAKGLLEREAERKAPRGHLEIDGEDIAVPTKLSNEAAKEYSANELAAKRSARPSSVCPECGCPMSIANPRTCQNCDYQKPAPEEMTPEQIAEQERLNAEARRELGEKLASRPPAPEPAIAAPAAATKRQR
jgi:hypothetical protein